MSADLIALHRLCEDVIGAHEALTPKQAKLLRQKTARVLDALFFDMAAALGMEFFFECGAHEAAASCRFARGGGTAIAVEASPAVFAKKTRRAGGPGVVTIHAALSDRPGLADFHTPRRHPLSGTASLRRKHTRKPYDTVTVPALTLDQIAAHFVRPESRSALWVDVEGCAAEVLRGGCGLLSSPGCALIKVELEAVEAWHGQAMDRDVDRHLSGHGFAAVFCDAEYEGQYNAIYARPSASEQCAPLVARAMAAAQSLTLAPLERLVPVVRKMGHSRPARIRF